MEQHDLIDYILSNQTNSFKTPPDGVSQERYEEAIDIAAELGLIKDATRSNYFVLPLGREVLAGIVRVSDSELVYLEARVETYFPQKAAAA